MAQAVDGFEQVLGIGWDYFGALARDRLDQRDGEEMTLLCKRETQDGVLYVWDLELMHFGDLKVHYGELDDQESDYTCDEIVFIHAKMKDVVILEDEFDEWVASKDGKRILKQSTIEK